MTIIVPAPESPDDFRPDILLTPGLVAFDESLQPLDSKLYSVIYWLEHMKLGRCTASNATLAKICNSSSSGIANSLVRLRDNSYIVCTYNNDGQREGINTLVRMRQGGYSNEEGGITQMSNRGSNNKTKDSVEFDEEIQKLYRLYLREMKVDPQDLAAASTPEQRRDLIIAASKRYKLTPKRRDKIRLRVQDAGYDMCKRAIINLGKSDWHRGVNDSGWSADIDWLFGSFEKTETWANKTEVY